MSAGAPCVAAVAAAVFVPVLAIGGTVRESVTAADVPDPLAAGAWVAAVVTAVSNAADPCAATRPLLASLAR